MSVILAAPGSSMIGALQRKPDRVRERVMRYRKVSRWACLAIGLGSAALVHAQAPAAPAAVPSDQDLAATRCAIGEEKFLPADYYYCLATQTYGQHRYSYALKFFREAAAWSSKPAQYVLGTMALDGDQQPVDRPLALAWFALAAERRQPRFVQAYQQLRAALSTDERARAEQLLAQMKPTYGDATAAVRAEQRYRQGMQTLAHLAPGSGYCMQGLTEDAQLAGGAPGADGPSITGLHCPPVQAVTLALDKTAEQVFDGWRGHVQVGALQPVEPAKP